MIKIPKYVQEMIDSKRLVSMQTSDFTQGCCFKLYRLSNGQWEGTFIEEAERLTAWAVRECKSAWTDDARWYTTKEHRKPYYKRDHINLTIAEPLAVELVKLINGGKL